jgi:hypothetical protein
MSADLPPAELRRMAQAIDAGLEPRVRIATDLSAEAVRRLRDVLAALAGDLGRQAGVEAAWPVVALLAVLEETEAAGSVGAAG